jgi:hypothetical protein
MATIKDLAEQYGLEDYEQLLGGYPNATKFANALQSNIESHIPTTEDLQSPERMGEWSLAAALNQPTGLAIKGYHGSPHKFKEFDTAHMGTGEGGQAYGWGNYITEDPYVATTYSPQDDWMDEQLMNLYNQAERRQDYPSMEVYERYMMHERPNEVKEYLNESYADYPEDLPKRLPAQKIGENLYKKQKGSHLYEVSMEFPKEREAVDPMSIEHFLDYDKPLSEQSDYVRNILQSHDPDMYHPEGPDYDPTEKGNSILQRFGSGKEGAQKLYELGIPGTTYMGEKAKVANPEGVRNFVTYSDEVPRVVTRNMNKVKPLTDEDRLNDLEKQMSAYMKTKRMPKGVDFKSGSDWYDWAYDKRAKLRGYAEGGSVDKDSLQLNKPQRTPSHPTKSHIVKTMVDGKEKIIRFGEQGAETAGKPKEGESDRMTAKRESFKARHAKNIAKGPSSAAYWANKVKWAEGGEVDNGYAKGGEVESAVEDYKQLLSGYPNAEKFFTGLKDAAYRSVPTTEQMRDPNFIIDNAGIGGIIKPKGGNWLDTFGRTPEKAASQFSRSVDPELAGYARAGMHLMPHEYNETVPVMAVNDWLQQKLGKYIKNEMGTPEDPIRRIAEEWPAKRDVLISQQQSKIPKLQDLLAKYEQDVELPPEVLANRIANTNRDIGGIQDKISELEGYNPLHYTPRDPREFDIDDVMAKREELGYPEEGIAKTHLGKLWEHYADENITPIRVKYLNSEDKNRNPWLSNLSDEDRVYLPDSMMGTGFDKLADELRKATRPDTDLPDFLRIDPAKLSRVSMPQAVEHVAKINAWRDAERLKEGRNTATVMHKEYPDQGLSWMQMKMPESKLQEGHYLGEDSRGNPAVLDSSGSVWSSASTPEEALAQYRDAERRDALKAALKFEGDTMGHCVGQYCDEVAGGDSNIYSLRDRRGEPHVTIETKGGGFDPNKFLDLNKQMINDDSYLRDKLKYLQENYANRPERQSDLMLDAMKKYGYEYQLPETMEKIVQIKGKQNAAPNAKYMPAVHDFVRSKDWSSVGDLDNTYLYDLSQPFLNPDLQEMVKNKYGKFATDDEINEMQQAFYEKNKDIPLKGFADGGKVDIRDDEGYADDLARLKRAYENSNFGPNDSMIASTIRHPAEAAKRAKDSLMRSIDTAAGVPREILDESSAFPFGIAPSMDEQAQAGLDLAGLAQTGAMPFAPESAGGTLGMLIKPMKASEAYGRIEGRPLYVTQADRTKVGGKFLGGPGFSRLQLEDPEYAEALAAWAVQNPSIASTIINGSRQAGEHDPVFTTFIGAPDQHRSNQMVFDYIYNDFKKASKKSDLFTPEKLDLMNERLANYYKDKSTKENLFPENINILDKNLKKYANTFDKRAAIAEVIGGKGIGGKKGQIIDYDKLLRSTSDPSFLDVPSGSLGNRLFTLNGEFLENRHDLHPAFPTILQGEDLGLVYQPVPRELVMKDFYNKIRQEKGREPGYFDWALGYPPSQLITEDLLTEMQKAGYAKGGEVKALHDKYEESDYGYGSRPDKTKKGLGYFGELERPDGTGVMTEYSIGVPIHGEEMDVPTLVPTLTPDEIRLILHMQDGDDMPRSIVHKAIDHAHQRLSEGKPIFATEEDLYAHGGIVDVLHNDAIEQIMKAFMDSMADDEEPSAPAVSIEITTQNTETPRRGKIPKSIAREAKHG